MSPILKKNTKYINKVRRKKHTNNPLKRVFLDMFCHQPIIFIQIMLILIQIHVHTITKLGTIFQSYTKNIFFFSLQEFTMTEFRLEDGLANLRSQHKTSSICHTKVENLFSSHGSMYFNI